MRRNPPGTARLPAVATTNVRGMFAPRQLLKRSFGLASSTVDPSAKAEDPSQTGARHPAMRGLDVSPVHGRHCICGRCVHHTKAA